jgi:hypothetical protein
MSAVTSSSQVNVLTENIPSFFCFCDDFQGSKKIKNTRRYQFLDNFFLTVLDHAQFAIFDYEIIHIINQ